ncbi:diacylglycerol kinase [Simiduia agarivorans]|uniref:Diacylglycerol kinase n=1 Tax=Simiduia agarivorans (strain DSM 21679 / JCM 13881 / BCRC 17597 / SA1) TaxID=1117647 RepID=K4KGV5_SIMAS|nr:diacylglycerol kinase [Simiduia agarivorans]AFU98221.1 diacylglycerol kinase DagK [Simiduia agarivorans SA1 = DSM 21679]
MKGNKQGLTRLINATRYSWQGLKSTWRTEAAFREEVPLVLVLIPLALWLDISAVESAVLIALSVLILVVELINSGIEAVVDRIGAEHHELSGKAKDVGSAAVLLTILVALTAWVLILGERYVW